MPQSSSESANGHKHGLTALRNEHPQALKNMYMNLLKLYLLCTGAWTTLQDLPSVLGSTIEGIYPSRPFNDHGVRCEQLVFHLFSVLPL